MADSNLHDDIIQIRDSMIEMIKGQARTEQKIDGLNDRLYDGGSGAIPVLFQKYEGLSTTAVADKGVLTAAISAVNTKVDRQRAYVAGAAAAATILIGGVKYALGKVGVHIP